MRLLILTCGSRKIATNGLVRAGQLYDGPIWRTYRANLQTARWQKPHALLILSAEYGFMLKNHMITTYERMMTPERAAELKASPIPEFAHQLVTHAADVTFVGSKLYAEVVQALPIGDKPTAGLQGYARQGDMLHAVKDFLVQHIPSGGLFEGA